MYESIFQEDILSGYINTHSEENPFKCSFCDKAFFHKGNLFHHIKTHTGDSSNVSYSSNISHLERDFLRKVIYCVTSIAMQWIKSI